MRIVPFLAAGVVLLAAAACSGDDEPAAQDPPASAPVTATATPSGDATATTAAPGSPSATSTARPSPGPPATASPGPSVAVTPLPPVRPGRESPLQPGVTVTLTKVANVQVTASGPGEVAGPGVAVTIRVRNTSPAAFDLGRLAVNATDRANIPANPGGSAQAKPLSGALAAGKSADGVYYFVIDAAKAAGLRVEVSSSSSPNIVVLER